MSEEVAGQVSDALTESLRTAHPSASGAGKSGTTEKDTASWFVGTAEKVSTAVVVYRIDLTKSLEPLPLEGIAGSAGDSVPYRIWSRATSPTD
jgi:membrane peptidoglycan carboxypeptidase